MKCTISGLDRSNRTSFIHNSCNIVNHPWKIQIDFFAILRLSCQRKKRGDVAGAGGNK
jgi:hypothetical protein